MIVTVKSKSDLIAAIKARRAQLGWSQLTLDFEAGLPEGYSGKLETSSGKPNSRSIGWDSLPKILAALGLKLTLNKGMLSAASHSPQALMDEGFEGQLQISVSKYFAALGKKGGLGRCRIPVERRKRLARKAALARWKNKSLAAKRS